MLQLVSLRTLRWTARVLGLLCVAILLLFIVGEGFRPATLTGRDLLLFLFFPVGVCLGMVVGWRREGWGGALTMGSLAAFYLAHFLITHRLPRGLWFAAFALPGALFLLHALCSRRAPHRPLNHASS